MKEHSDWNDRYRDGNLPWNTGQPSSELQRVFSRNPIQPCRALELGCGTGTNSVWLAQQGFEVTGIDLAPLAVERAEQRAHAAGVTAHFVVGDVLHLPELEGPFAFFFDRGCYHAVRRDAPKQYAPAVARQLASGGRGLILAGKPGAYCQAGIFSTLLGSISMDNSEKHYREALMSFENQLRHKDSPRRVLVRIGCASFRRS